MNQSHSTLLHQKLATLFSRINYERHDKATPKSFKLNNMRRFLKVLGNPHLDYPVIHIAGTKGKGSIAAIMASILAQAGLKVGVYSSPHLETFHQRMKINGVPISDKQLFNLLDFVEPFALAVDQQLEEIGFRPLTFFEVATGAMFCHFSRQTVDIALVEVGLGGRLDSTNVCKPDLTVISNISFDHTTQLGHTLAAIAGEKAGIIKPDIPVICGAVQSEAMSKIHEIAAKNNSPLCQLNRDFQQVGEENSLDHDSFAVSGTFGDHSFAVRQLKCGLMGEHQKTNSAIAIASLQAIPAIRERLDNEIIRKGVLNVSLEGRAECLEVLQDNEQRTVLLDIAHNEAAVKALIDVLNSARFQCQPIQKRHLLFGTSRDKDVKKMLEVLLPHFDRICLTKYQNNPRGVSIAQLTSILQTIRDEQPKLAIEVETEPDPVLAAQLTLESSRPGDLLIMTGSAFLIAELRPWAFQKSARQAQSVQS